MNAEECLTNAARAVIDEYQDPDIIARAMIAFALGVATGILGGGFSANGSRIPRGKQPEDTTLIDDVMALVRARVSKAVQSRGVPS